MTLMELKKCITDGKVPSEFMILESKDNQFLAKQYLKAIEKNAVNGVTKIKSIYEPKQSSIALLTASEETVNVCYIDTFEERAEDYSQFKNTIVVCNQIDKNVSAAVKDFIIKLPKFETWQIYDYIKTLCPILEEEELMWLISAADNSIERILNEVGKAALFEGEEQKAIFSSIRFDPQLDLYKADLFKIVNALIEGDLITLYNFLKLNDYEVLDPVMLANRALNSLKNIILVSQLAASDLNMSDKQYSTLQRKYNNVNITAIKQKIKFLTNFDFALKNSRLDISKRDMLNYLINNLSYRIIN